MAGADVNPFPHLKKATKPLFAAPRGCAVQPRRSADAARRGRQRLRLSATRFGRTRAGSWLEIDARPLDLVSMRVEPKVSSRDRAAQTVSEARRRSRRRLHGEGEVTRDALLGAPGVARGRAACHAARARSR